MRSLNLSAPFAAAATALLIASSTAFAQTGVTKTDATPGNFDNSSGTRTFTVSAADMAAGTVVNQVTLSIDFEKYDGSTFGVNDGGTPYYNEIFFTLTNPAGITTSLIAANSFQSGANGFRGVITFDDAAPTLVNANPGAILSGVFQPTGPGSMADLKTASGIGTWTLSIADTANSDHLGYYSSTLNLNGGVAVVPEAGTFALALPALSMVGAVVIKRRKK